MKLLDLVHPQAILPHLTSRERNGAIRELVEVLTLTGGLPASSAESVVKSIIARERTRGTTGFGKGMAAPHAKIDGLPAVIAAVGRSEAGIDFSSLDGAPVHGVFLIISPAESPEEHLRAMDLVFRNLQQEKFRKFLRQSETAEAVLELLKDADDKALA
jgi:mannitol/fructose-specific phosphotransferase system IIA component (Ntr-type)